MNSVKRGQIIAIANQKGGVGKTTLAVHLAAGATRAGKRVILVDADPQGNTSSWLLDGETSDEMFKLLIVNEAPVRLVRAVSAWKMGLLAGNFRTGEAMQMLAAVGRLAEVPGRLAPLRDVADYVIVDMPPSRAAGFTELLSAADWVIVPTQLERMSLEGVVLMAQTAKQLRDQGRGPRLMGVVPNMTRKRTVEHREQMESLVSTFGAIVWPPLPLTIKVTEAASFGQTLFDLSPKEDVTAQMQRVVRRMLETGG